MKVERHSCLTSQNKKTNWKSRQKTQYYNSKKLTEDKIGKAYFEGEKRKRNILKQRVAERPNFEIMNDNKKLTRGNKKQ